MLTRFCPIGTAIGAVFGEWTIVALYSCGGVIVIGIALA